jgi:dihydroxy-acid dehydratase
MVGTTDIRTLTLMTTNSGQSRRSLRSSLWFDNPDNPGMTALYLERYLNYGITRADA